MIRTSGGCPAAENLKAYVDGELAFLDALALRSHLAACVACAEEARIMKAIGVEVRGMAEAAAPPEGLREAVLARLEFAPETQRRLNRFDVIRWGVMGAFIASVAAVLFPVFATSRESARPASALSNLKQIGSALMMYTQDHDALLGMEPPGGAPAKKNPFSANAELHFNRRWTDGHFKDPRNPSDWLTFDDDEGRNGLTKDATPNDVNRYARGAAVEDVRRKVVQNADLGVRVGRKLEGVQDEVSARVKADGGYVEDASLSAPPKGDRTASMTLRVPVARFEGTISYLAALGEVTSKNLYGEDVTGRWVDERAQVKELRAEEARLLKAYEAAQTNERRWEARSQLLRIRPQIRSAEDRFALTGKLAALATIRLTLTEEPQARIQGNLLRDMGNTLRAAVAGFMIAIRVPASILIWLAVFAPLWLPCLLIYRWATRMSRLHPRL